MQVRKAQGEDFKAVCRLYDDVIAVNSGSEYDVLWRRDLHPSDAALSEAIASGTMYLAEVSGVLVGAGIVNQDFAPGYDTISWSIETGPDEAECLHLYCIHPDCSGQGLGTCFLQGIMADCAVRGVKTLRLDVFAYNTPGRHLYEKVGFVLRGITRLAYEDQQVGKIDFAMYECLLNAEA